MLAVSDSPVAATGPIPPLLQLVYDVGIRTEFIPPVIFLGVGALTDFRPLLARPITFLLGAAAQLGVFVAAMGANRLLGFTPGEAASIGIIGGADGPTTIYLTSLLAPHLLGPVAVAAYSYMSLVPIIQPPVLRLLTTRAERAIDMPQAKPVSQAAVIAFPIVTAAVTALAVPSCAALVGLLMFGNLLRESGVTERLVPDGGRPDHRHRDDLPRRHDRRHDGRPGLPAARAPSTSWSSGAVAFVFSTAGGILFAKALNLVLPRSQRLNPCIGAAGVSAVPMSARVVQDFVSRDTNGKVNPLMPAMGPNVAGVIGTAVAAGVFLALLR